MKNILFINIFLFLIFNISFGQSYNDLQQEKEWKEKTKKEKETVFRQKIKTKFYFSDDVLSSMSRFDKRGNLIEQIKYSDYDTITRKNIYKYDDNDILLEEYYFGPYNGTPTRIEYLYDDKNNKIRKTEFDARMKMSQITSWVYNRQGNPDRKITINWRYDTSGIIKYQYDELNRMIKATHFINTKIFNLLYEYKYDNQDNIIEWSMYDNVGFIMREIYEFDERGNKIREIAEGKTGERRTNEKFIYDEHNNLISRIYFEGKDTNKIRESDNYKYIYNANGNVQEEYLLTSEGISIIQRSCEYDEKGNIIRIILYYDNGEKYYEDNYCYDIKGNMISECSKEFGNHMRYENEDDAGEIENKSAEYTNSQDCSKYEYEFYE